MRTLTLLALLSAASWPAHAGSVNFEDLPNANIAGFCGGGDTNIGSFYAASGVANIGANVFGLAYDCGGGTTAFPPNPGAINVISTDDFARFDFTTQVWSVSIHYVADDPIQMLAFDSSNNQIGSTIGLANTDGVTPPSSNGLLTVNAAHIAYVTVGNTGLAFGYTLDDLAFTVPEPGTWLFLISGAALICARKARRPLF